jgi:hypothetical protein
MLGKNDIITFGKYANKTINYIWENDPQYIIWLDENVNDISIDQFIVNDCRESETEEYYFDP